MTSPYRVNSLHVTLCVPDMPAERNFLQQLFRPEVTLDLGAIVHYAFYGNQLVIHEVSGWSAPPLLHSEGDGSPIPHIGIVVEVAEYETVLSRAEASWQSHILVASRARRRGTPLEHRYFFVQDPAGHAVEVKSYVQR